MHKNIQFYPSGLEILPLHSIVLLSHPGQVNIRYIHHLSLGLGKFHLCWKSHHYQKLFVGQRFVELLEFSFSFLAGLDTPLWVIKLPTHA